MLCDVMHLVGVVPYDVAAYEAESDARRQARLTGLPSKGGGAKLSSADAAAGCGGGGGSVRYASMPRTVQEAEEMDFRGEPSGPDSGGGGA